MAIQLTRAWIIPAFAVLAACGGSGGGNGGAVKGGGNLSLVSTPKSMLTLQQSGSCSALGSYISDSIADVVLNVGIVDCPGCETVLQGGVATAQATPVAAASFDAFTGTNNQESGVDEVDQIEADQNGNFYMLDGRYLVVANGLPPDNLRQIASIELDPDRRGEGLLLDADNGRLVVLLSQSISFGPVPLSFAPVRWDPITELLFVDVTDPTNPVIDNRLKVEGYRLAARRIDNRIHLVSHWTPIIPAEISGDAELNDLRQQLTDVLAGGAGDADALERAIRARVDLLVAAIDIESLVPALSAATGTQPFVDIGGTDCTDVAVPDVALPLALTSVTSVDSDGSNVDVLHIVNDSWNVYMSANNLYLSQVSAGWWFSDRQKQQTAIYKIEVGAGAAVYRATGLVGGWAGSSFQFSEHAGFLRVATNRSEFDPAADAWVRDNNLYVLEDDSAGSMNVIGSVTGFAEDESLFSARFLGDRGFVVTFRQIDPLFAFDLSVPQDPRLVGEVEIPGVSTYIHPLDDTHLLTIGFGGDQNRLNGDFQLQIFDVQDLSDPRLIHKFAPTFGGTGFAWTPATYDHLAFNYFPEAGTLTVPLQYYASALDEHFSGFIAFSVDTATGFTELGRLDHSDLARQMYCMPPTGVVPATCQDGSYLEAADPRRSVSAMFNAETFIYTLSNVGMKVSAADDFENAIAVLPLPYRDDYPWIAY